MSVPQKWLQICFYLLFITLNSFSLVNSGDTKELTFCDQSSTDKFPNSLLYVSTLDGKISALDARNNGEKQWSLDFHQGPMLSSNIHRRELNNNGQWVRLIPSLSGGLYKFDGDNLESVPISADQLLHSSFRYSDDLVFSGGKETKSYGVSSQTGKILYECGINGCTNNTDGEGQIDQDILVIKRFQQTVRAIEPRTGIERWNFSVGQHDLVLVPQSKFSCRNKSNIPQIEIKVIVPDGLIWAVNKENPSVKLWQYKFDSPIVSIWHEGASQNNKGHGGLKEVNLFDNSQWSWGSKFSDSPRIYVGMHERQLYIQENFEFLKALQTSPKYMQPTRYPWQPYPAIGTTLVKTTQSPSDDIESSNPVLEIDEAQSTTALSVLYNSEYINGNGYYLYSKNQLDADNNNQCNHTEPELLLIEAEEDRPYVNNYTQEDDTPVQVIIVSLWYWWKEVLIISITTAILLNFMLTQRLLNATTAAKDAVLPPLIIERPIETEKSATQNSENDTIDTFKSRYLNDFEPVDCLGKGGYGVVFEAKNKIDDCNYAIKRIALPNSQYSRDRVMREVKALAKLDHHNIVRYFNAWLECPPAGWQEKHDEQWINKLKFPASDFASGLITTETKASDSVCITVSQTDQSSVDSACEAYALNAIPDEDSFIVFGKPNSMSNGENIIDISDCSTETSDVSISDNVAEEILSKENESVCSDSIVFEKCSNNSLNVTNSTNNVSERDKSRPRKSSISLNLNLNNKSTTRKSPKMFLYIQMQLCQRLSLREWLKQQPTRDSRRILNIFQQITDAVEYVHLQGLIHRDLKPSNIFFAFDDKIKVGDFGLVTAMTEGYSESHTPAAEDENVTLKTSPHTACVGTHLYMSPEQMNGQRYNYKVDIYSLGIILFELLIPFLTEMERIDALMNLKKSIYPKNFEETYPAEYNLLRMMLDEQPANRPTTLGIKARPPLSNCETASGMTTIEDSKWHFELPQLSRHSSVTSSSSGESWENVG